MNFAIFLNLVWRNKKQIFIINFLAFLIAIIVSLLLPKVYKGRVVFIVNQSTSNSAIANIVGTMPFNLLGGSGDKITQYYNFLTSRRILDQIDSLYNLQKFYENDYRFQYYSEVKSNLVLTDNQDGTITIEFYHKNDSLLAANIANSFFKELNKLSLALNQQRNRELRIFLESSYNKTIEDLQRTENSLKELQETEKIYNVEAQSEQLIKSISELQIQMIQLQIEKNQKEIQFGKKNNQVKLLENTISEIKSKVAKLKQDSTFIDVPLNQLPEKSLKYFRYIRDIKIYEKVLEFLVPQLENAKFEEHKTASDLQLLDKAEPEDYKTKPKRALIVIVVVFLSTILSILYTVIKEYYFRNKSLIKKIFSKEAILT